MRSNDAVAKPARYRSPWTVSTATTSPSVAPGPGPGPVDPARVDPSGIDPAQTRSSARARGQAEQGLDPPPTRGRTFISDEVVSIIARRAAEQTEGIHQVGESSLRSVFARLGRHHGVEAEVGLKQAAIEIEIVVEFGHPIREVAQSLREGVIDAVESMTGRSVVEVDVHVVDIHVADLRARPRRQLE